MINIDWDENLTKYIYRIYFRNFDQLNIYNFEFNALSPITKMSSITKEALGKKDANFCYHRRVLLKY
jgi:hypothetical protein